MFENLYTTKMSANKKTLQNRFEKIRSESGPISNAFSIAILILILMTLLYAHVVTAAMNEREEIYSTNDNDKETIISYLPPKNSERKLPQKDIQNFSAPQPVSYDKDKKSQSTGAGSGENITGQRDIKSSAVADELYVGIEQIIMPDINSDEIQNELQNNGITHSQSETVDLKTNYTVNDISADNTKVTADENGNISIYMSVESDNLFNVKITDAETNENVEQTTILANNDNIYTFLGFEKGKSYNVEVTSRTQKDWDISGNYILY